MAFWTYMLRCSDGRYYTGHTDNLEVRLAQHQAGFYRSCWTYKRRPVELVWCEYFQTRLEALEAERRVGGWSAAKKEALVMSDWKQISHFARPPSERTDPRFSTSLETNGTVLPTPTPTPFVSSEVEKRAHEPASPPNPNPFVSSEVEKRASEPASQSNPVPFVSSEVEKRAHEPASPPNPTPFVSSEVEKRASEPASQPNPNPPVSSKVEKRTHEPASPPNPNPFASSEVEKRASEPAPHP